MRYIGLSLTTQSPVLLSKAPPAQNLMETLDVVPGNSLRGLLAWHSLQKGADAKDQAFRRLFLQGKTRFGFARINGSQAIPLSARSCKYGTGFKKDGGHGVMDLLLADDKEKRCRRAGCGQSVDYLEGFWNPGDATQMRVLKRLITRTAIDPVLGTAASGQLYSQRVIEEGQIFRAVIEVPEDLSGELEKLIADPFVAGIGTGRSRGQGWVEVRRDVPSRFELCQSAGERFDRFKSTQGIPVLAVTLLSDGIFHDEYLRDCTAPSLYHLEALGIDSKQWDPILFRAFASSGWIFGFDGVPLCLPRTPRLAVAAGSAFLFKAKDGFEPTIPVGDGVGWIGDNNREGFGHAVLWHPFHLDPEQEADS